EEEGGRGRDVVGVALMVPRHGHGVRKRGAHSRGARAVHPERGALAASGPPRAETLVLDHRAPRGHRAGRRAAGQAHRDRVVHQGLRLVDDRRWQRLEGERGDELSEPDGERCPLHGASSTCRRPWSIMRPMKPREERLRVGSIDVHTWIGGDGAPLLVLHGAGGNRGFTRWMERVARRYTVWAPTHPGFGLSGDAEWMDGIDDLARFYLWFMDTAGLTRPHVLRHSIGGWTAAEMATMSPGAIDRL